MERMDGSNGQNTTNSHHQIDSWSGSSMCYLHETKQAHKPEMQSQQLENQLEDSEKKDTHTSTPCLSKIKALQKFASIVAAVHGHPQADHRR